MQSPTPSDWNEYTSSYSLNFLHRSLPHSSDLLSLLSARISSCSTVLDLCCGPGTFLLSYVRQFPHGVSNQTLICVDSSPQMILKARENAKAWLPSDFQTNVVFKVADACDLGDVNDGGVDVVVSCLGVFLVEQQERVLKEVKRVLRKDGVFAATAWTSVKEMNEMEQYGFGPMISKIANPVMASLMEGQVEINKDGAWMIWADQNRIKKHLEDHGFEQVKVRRSLHTQTMSEEDVWKMVTETSPMGYRGGASEEKVKEARDKLKSAVADQEDDRFFVNFLANVVVAKNGE